MRLTPPTNGVDPEIDAVLSRAATPAYPWERGVGGPFLYAAFVTDCASYEATAAPEGDGWIVAVSHRPFGPVGSVHLDRLDHASELDDCVRALVQLAQRRVRR